MSGPSRLLQTVGSVLDNWKGKPVIVSALPLSPRYATAAWNDRSGYRNAVKPASSPAWLLAADSFNDKVLKGFETCEFFGAYDTLHTWMKILHPNRSSGSICSVRAFLYGQEKHAEVGRIETVGGEDGSREDTDDIFTVVEHFQCTHS